MKNKLFIILFLSGCVAKADVQSIAQPGAEYCIPACDNLIKLNCDLGKTVNGETCYVRCNKQQNDGLFWNTYCLESINSCDMIDNWCKAIYEN